MSTTQKPKSASDWKSRSAHTVTLPSGAVVDIVIPNLPLLVKIGKLPNELLQAVVQFQQAREVTQEMMAEQHEFTTKLVTLTVKSPELTDADVTELPYEDVEMLVEFAMRSRDMDAVGHHL